MKPIQFPPESEQPAAPVPGQPFTEFDFYGFSKRQRAAIDLRVPCSGLPWLDAMIKAARWLDAAQVALGREWADDAVRTGAVFRARST